MKNKLVAAARYVSARLKERSTYTGLILLLTASGVAVDPARIEVIIPIGIGLASVLEIFLADSKPAL